MDPEKHRRYTGGKLEVILENIKCLCQAGKQLIIRIPLIPRYNDDAANIHQTGRFLAATCGPTLQQVQVLQYHELGKSKYAALGQDYPLADLEKPSREEYIASVRQAVAILQDYGLPAHADSKLVMVAAGAAAHSDHGRDLVETLLAIGEGSTTDYAIRDEAKLRRIAEEVGLDVAGKETKAVALALAEQFYEDFGSRRGSVSFIDRVPAKRRALWETLGITPRGIDREVVEMMHRTHMCCAASSVQVTATASKAALGAVVGSCQRSASRRSLRRTRFSRRREYPVAGRPAGSAVRGKSRSNRCRERLPALASMVQPKLPPTGLSMTRTLSGAMPTASATMNSSDGAGSLYISN